MSLQLFIRQLNFDTQSFTKEDVSCFEKVLLEFARVCKKHSPSRSVPSTKMSSGNTTAVDGSTKNRDVGVEVPNVQDFTLLFKWITLKLCAFLPNKSPCSKNKVFRSWMTMFDSFLSFCREQRCIPQSDSIRTLNCVIISNYQNCLDKLITQLLYVFKETVNQNTVETTGIGDEQETNAFINLICKIIGYLLLGNLSLFRAETLVALTRSFTDVLTRNADRNPADFVSVYGTLSHLTFLRSVWTKRDTVGSCVTSACDDFLSESQLHQSVLDAFLIGLKRSSPTYRNSLVLDAKETPLFRQIVMSCLNGIAQLLICRTCKLAPSTSVTVVRTLWPHVVALSRQCSSFNKKNDFISQSTSDSCSEFSSPSLRQSVEDLRGAIPPKSDSIVVDNLTLSSQYIPPWTTTQPFTLTSTTRFSSTDQSWTTSSSEDEFNATSFTGQYISGATEAIANRLLVANSSHECEQISQTQCIRQKHVYPKHTKARQAARSDLPGARFSGKPTLNNQVTLFVYTSRLLYLLVIFFNWLALK
ncbi:hypothetical protein EG68_09084 [Paragonimus skrjabini miyazakii]|uniref:Uncharacterized protein n=1 Tax=Paragonimus skrjabini miyazakii TaxID=59628 RepID=A0A8S9YQ80_9TREM|nr:hypothetical protein EG68_09084 [Paragonimus skrjabini miyazakii]